MGNFSSGFAAVRASVPYSIKLQVYKDIMAAIQAREDEEMRKRTPGLCRLFLYWLQNIVALPEGLIRLVWHLLIATLAYPCFCIISAPYVEEDGLLAQQHVLVGGSRGTKVVVSREAGSGQGQLQEAVAEKNPEESCIWLTFVHHSTMVRMYFESLRLILRNIVKPWSPIWLYDLFAPIEKPPAPKKPRVSFGNCFQDCFANCVRDCFESCFESCFASCGRAIEMMVHITLRLTRAMYCAFSCHHSCHPSITCGACCSCCRGCYDHLPLRIDRWTEEHNNEIRERTRDFYLSTYGVETYEEACRIFYQNYQNPPQATVVPEAGVMEGRENATLTGTQAVHYATLDPSAPPQKVIDV
mmetsp:Transcript_29860/g.39252  ORF Transcript_29860/g.39252 Transcript_29860/m.39252 type:complete len:356 (-) Transcript_29860:413-1480(-)